jgi:hypothetical protein
MDELPTRSVAVRTASGFAVATNCADPSPVPLVRVPRSHDALVDASHEHPGVADTPRVTVPPAAATFAADAVHAIWHAAASCRSGNFAPFTVTEPVRLMPFGFAATTTETAVSPCPVWGVTWSQAESDSTLHAHSRAVAIVAANSPPPAATESGSPAIEEPHRWLVGVESSETVVLPHAATAQAQRTTNRWRIS